MKKIAVLTPVVVLAAFYVYMRYDRDYATAGIRGIVSLGLAVGVMLLVMAIGVFRQQQRNFTGSFLQSTFLIYIFMVLTLTGYLLFFREVTGHGWWHEVKHRIELRERINFKPFLTLKQFGWASVQVLGNLVMLVPLAFYLPSLFRGFDRFAIVLLTCFLTSVAIELMQLITAFRACDVDDVIMNTSGSVLGYLMFLFIRKMIPGFPNFAGHEVAA